MTATARSAQRLKAAAGSVVLTARGKGFAVGALASFVAAHLLTFPALNYVACLLLGLILCAGVFVFVGHSRVNISRTFSPDVVSQQEPSQATVTFTNLSTLPSLEADWQDRLPSGIVGDATGVIPALGGGHGKHARTKLSYSVHGVRRGRHLIGPLTVRVPDPFGLVHRTHTFGEPQALIVLPRRVDLHDISFGGANIAGATRPAPQHVGVGDDDVIARNYMAGDSLRRMHWKATAHRGQLMVRQEEQRNNPEATVLLDLDAESHGTMRDSHGEWAYSPAFEWAIVAAASVAAHLVHRGYLVNVISPGGAVHRSIADGFDTVHEVMTDLAIVGPAEISRTSIAAMASSERPVVAVVGHVDAARVGAWSGLNSSTGLMFLAASSEPEALEILRQAGWKCRTYRPSDDIADLWLDLDAREFHASR